MQKSMIRCFRCDGRKKLFKFNNGYTLVDMGCVSVPCPLCLGEGMIPNLDQAINDLIEKQEPIETIKKSIQEKNLKEKKVTDDEKTIKKREKA